jgi:molybdopterin-guanine dinucleotide biosynthesis protein A
MTDIAGIILCGGESRRMRQSKAWLDFGSEKLLQRVVRLVRSVAAPIVVVAAPDQELPTLPDAIRVVRDAVEGRGPLEGLLAGLTALPEKIDLAYATATDVPFLQPEFVLRLAELIGDADLAIPYSDGFHHPLSALYRPQVVRPVVEELLAQKRLAPSYLMEAVKTRVVAADELRAVDPMLVTLRNLNTPADYQQALKDAGLAR